MHYNHSDSFVSEDKGCTSESQGQHTCALATDGAGPRADTRARVLTCTGFPLSFLLARLL